MGLQEAYVPLLLFHVSGSEGTHPGHEKLQRAT